MINCFDINLNVNPLREGIDITSYGKNKHTRISFNDINLELISVIQLLNLNLVLAELFYSKPYLKSEIHLDVQGGDYTKLNYIYGGKDSIMYWHKQISDIKKSASTTTITTSYIPFYTHEVELIDKATINFPSIVQVGIPHNIHNFKEPRYCLSLVLTDKDNNRLTMDDSIKIFDRYRIK